MDEDDAAAVSLGERLWNEAGALQENLVLIRILCAELTAGGSGPDVTGSWANFSQLSNGQEWSFCGASPLHWAAACGRLAALTALLECGGTMEFEDEDGATVLHCAATYGHTEVVSELLGRGANPRAADSTGCTPLMSAVRRGHEEVARMLLKSSPEAAKDANGAGCRALGYVSGETPLSLIKMIHTASPEAIAEPSQNGYIPYQWAMFDSAHLDVLVYLWEETFLALGGGNEGFARATATPMQAWAPPVESSVEELLRAVADRSGPERVRAAACHLLSATLTDLGIPGTARKFFGTIVNCAELLSDDPLFSIGTCRTALLVVIARGHTNLVWGDGLPEVLAAAVRDGCVDDLGTAAAFSVLLSPRCPMAPLDFPPGWNILLSACQFITRVRSFAAPQMVQRAWASCDRFITTCLERDFPETGFRRAFALDLLGRPGVLYDAVTAFRPTEVDNWPVQLLIYSGDGETGADYEFIATIVLKDPTFAFIPAFHRGENTLSRLRLINKIATLVPKAAAALKSYDAPAPAAGAMAPDPAGEGSLPGHLRVTICALLCLEYTEASDDTAQIIAHLTEGPHMRDLVRLLLLHPATGDDERTHLGCALRAAAAVLAEQLERSARSYAGASRGVAVPRPPKRRRILEGRRADAAAGGTEEEVEEFLRPRPILELTVAGREKPIYVNKVLWLRWLAEGSVLRELILRDDALAVETASARSSVNGGAPPAAGVAAEAESHSPPAPPLAMRLSTVLSGGDAPGGGAAVPHVPEGTEYEHFCAVVHFLHSFDETREPTLPNGVDPLSLYAMAAYLGFPSLMDACLDALCGTGLGGATGLRNLDDDATLDALCQICMADRPRTDDAALKAHEARAAGACAWRLLRAAPRHAPMTSLPPRAVAVVAEAAEAALRAQIAG